MKKQWFRNGFFQLALVGLLLLALGGCASNGDRGPDAGAPWTVTATAAPWLTSNPYGDKHDGGWVYSAREDCLYAMYGNDNSGRTLYRIDHIGETSAVATTFLFNRHGAQPVIDNTGTYIYMPPSGSTNELERYNTVTFARETLATAPGSSTYSHGAWKDGKLWMVLNDYNLYSYDPVGNAWSVALDNFGARSNIASSGAASDLIYIIAEPGDFYSYNVTTGTTTTLAAHPGIFDLGGNGQFTWFGSSVGFLYALGSEGDDTNTPAIYDIANSTWHELSDPNLNTDYAGHATYDTSRQRLYVTGDDDEVRYYQF